jgi:DNA polymerase delta subunit 2
MTQDDGLVLRRGATSSSYAANDSRFSLANKMHGQYFQLYYSRFRALAPRVRDACSEAFGSSVPQRTVLELVEGERCVVIGTLYKDMRLKPVILDEYVKDYDKSAVKTLEKYTAEDDRLELEDDSARLKLVNIDAAPFITGVVVGCVGKAVKGDFVVEDTVVFAPANVQAKPKSADGSEASFVCLVSGFEIGEEDSDATVRNQMFVDYITGVGGDDDDVRASGKICRVIVAGGVLKQTLASADDAAAAKQQTNGSTDANGAVAAAAARSRPLKELDMMLTELVSAVPVDVMSGKSDPSNQAMPQQPLHPVYFPEASRYEHTLHTVTNPHDFTVNQTAFLGTSGQNVADVMKFSDIGDENVSFIGDDAAKRAVAALSATLRWQHIAPSAPDTLACYPFKDRDPFVMETTPHVYFAGCQEAFGYERVTHPNGGETVVISVPKFSTTGTVVLVNTSTLEVFPLTFEC